MLRTAIAFAITALLAGPAAAQIVPTSLDRIAYSEAEPFGSYSIAWEVDSSGAGWIRENRRVRGGRTTTGGPFDVGRLEFERLTAILHPLEGAGDCPAAIEDDVMAVVTWTRQSEEARGFLNFSCPNGGREAWARGQEATAIVRQWAGNH